MRSFSEAHPDLVKEWSPDNMLGPDQVSYGSKKLIIWNGTCGHTWTSMAKERGRGFGCPYCAGKKVLVGFNDLASRFPALAKEWSSENVLRPDEVTVGSCKSYLWIGSCGHSWVASVKNRANGHGCPICSGNKIVAGLNDFASRFPEVAKEWSDRNYPSLPTNWGSKSNMNVWWRCSVCCREWQARISDRTDGSGCPYCLKDSIEERKRTRITAYKLQVQENQLLRHIGSLVKKEDFQFEVLKYYASRSGCTVMQNYDYGIGIPVQLYFPEKCAAIELTSYIHEGWLEWRCENAKNWLCQKTDTKLVRIIPKGMKAFESCKCVRIRTKTIDALNYAVRQAFKKIKIPMDVDIVRDYDEIRRQKHDED